MAVPCTRTNIPAVVTIDRDACRGCGLCVAVCKDFGLRLAGGKTAMADEPVFGCFGCGHCMAICPAQAIRVVGRTLSPTDLFPLPEQRQAADYPQLLALMQRRRSVREFTGEPVAEDIAAKILQAAETAPMGIPPSDVHVMVLDTREKVGQFSRDVFAAIERHKWLTSAWFLRLMRPFRGKANDAIFRDFIKPLMDGYRKSMAQGQDMILYDAPLALYFYGSPYSEADQMIAATYAMLAGEALGLGACMIGAVHPFLQHGRAGALLREKYSIKYKSKTGLVVIFGHPAVAYPQGIQRTFADVQRV